MAKNFSHNRTIEFQKLQKRLLRTVVTHKRWWAIGAVVLLAVVQIAIYNNRLPVFSTIDGITFGNWRLADVENTLQQAYKNTVIDLRAKGAKETLVTISPHKFGIVADVSQRVKTAKLPLWLQVAPLSPLWGHWLVRPVEASYKIDDKKLVSYINTRFGADCKIAPHNASLRVSKKTIEVVKSRLGGACEYDQLRGSLRTIKYRPQGQQAIEVPVKPIYPAVSNKKAEELKKVVVERLKKPLVISAADKQVSVSPDTVYTWLRFSAPDKEIVTTIDASMAEPFLRDKVAPLVAKEPGITRIATKDFVEVSRSEGAKGIGLQYERTRQAVANYIVKKSADIKAVTQPLQPKLEYSRSYSNTDEGLSALLKQYAEDRKGEFGVALIELDGKRRHAAYNGDKQFTSASTYKLFVALAVLKRVEAGQMSWGEPVVDSRNLEKCFDDMIVLSDNPCPLALIKKIGANNLQKEAKDLGLQGINFLDTQSFKMTASDLAKFAAMLESGQLPIASASHYKLLAAMKRNVHRQGIPAGSSGTVADKVGFIDAFLHDVGVVYGTNGGTYALAILTEGSSWGDIAELTKRIEALRNQ